MSYLERLKAMFRKPKLQLESERALDEGEEQDEGEALADLLHEEMVRVDDATARFKETAIARAEQSKRSGDAIWELVHDLQGRATG